MMSILRANHLHRVDRVGVPARSQWGLGDWQLLRSSVPEQNLTSIGPSADEVWVKRRKRQG